jgi:hypothetical protein
MPAWLEIVCALAVSRDAARRLLQVGDGRTNNRLRQHDGRMPMLASQLHAPTYKHSYQSAGRANGKREVTKAPCRRHL